MSEQPESTPQKMQVCKVELRTPSGVMRGQVAIDTGPMCLAELVPTAFELTNVLVGQANRRETSEGRPISCCAGCGACCRQMVPVSPPEAFYLMDVIDSFEPVKRDTILKRFDSVVSELEQRDLIDRLLNPVSHEGEQVMAVALQYFQLSMPCPFLVDESCSIHAHRPVACREYNVTSPAAWCAQPDSHDIAKVPMPIPLSAPLARMTAKLTGEKPQLIPLTLIPRWVAAHDDLRHRTWPGPDLFSFLMTEIDTRGQSESLRSPT